MSNEKKNDGGPVFPVNGSDLDAPNEIVSMGLSGMSLRDYFAGKVIASHAAQMPYRRNTWRWLLWKLHLTPIAATGIHVYWNHDPNSAAASAYVYADAMLKAREQ
jgi:uncharacterized iron-regulated membrane protein